MLDERKEQRRFTKGCLLISMTFYEFSKPAINFQDFSRFSMTGYTLVKRKCTGNVVKNIYINETVPHFKCQQISSVLLRLLHLTPANSKVPFFEDTLAQKP